MTTSLSFVGHNEQDMSTKEVQLKRVVALSRSPTHIGQRI